MTRKIKWSQLTRIPLFIPLLLIASVLISGCASKRPVLYPNAHFNSVGQERANWDVDECMQMARAHGADSDQSERIAKDTVGGAAVGGATGAAVGAVVGNLGKGAAAGAAGGAAGAMTRGIIRSDTPDAVFQRFVEQCLRDKGYQTIGWQ